MINYIKQLVVANILHSRTSFTRAHLNRLSHFVCCFLKQPNVICKAWQANLCNDAEENGAIKHLKKCSIIFVIEFLYFIVILFIGVDNMIDMSMDKKNEGRKI